jgi:electron transfer flavoprotein beta subunit
MKIIVPVKRVADANAHVRLKSDGSGIETNGVQMSINPFDEIAVEEAIRLKEKGVAQEIVTVSIGRPEAAEALRSAFAIGADRGLLVTTDSDVEPLAVAKILKAVVDAEKPELVILGKQATDYDCDQAGQMLAGLLGWPQATFASRVEVKETDVLVTREVDGGHQTLRLRLPAIITCDLRLNTPRFASLPSIMKAKKKPITQKTLDSYRIDAKPRLEILKFSEPPRRKAGVKVKSVPELLDRLRNEAGVL